MKKSKLKDVLTRPEWIAVGLTVLFAAAALILTLRPKTELTLGPALRAAPAETAVIDLNTADRDALQTLPGIGPELSQRILDYRTAHGGFRTAGELTEIEGIGEKTYAELLPYITVTTEEAP